MTDERQGYENIPGVLLDATEDLRERLNESKEEHARIAVETLRKTGAPVSMQDAVEGQVKLSSIRPPAIKERLGTYQRFRGVFFMPLSSAVETIDYMDHSSIMHLCSDWFGVNRIIDEASRRHFIGQPESVAGYSSWQQGIVVPRLKDYADGQVPPSAYSATQYEAAYYSTIRPRAYASGVSMLALQRRASEKLGLEEGSSEISKLIEDIQAIYLHQYVEIASDPVSMNRAGRTSEYQVSAFAFNAYFIDETNRQFVSE